MFSLPVEGSAIVQQFRALFNKRSFALLEKLLIGALLSIGSRTVCAALRIVGLGWEKGFSNYHRFLSRSRWSALKAARILLLLLVETFCAKDEPLIFGIDETIERRRGANIKAKGIYRDPVRSSRSHFVKCSGLRWMCVMLLPPITWAQRVWALPFLSALAPSERYCKEQKQRHKKITDWARQLLLLLARWLPGRKIIVTADSSYSALELLAAVRERVTLITRLRMDAALYDPVETPEPEQKKRGRPRLKGERQPTLQQRLTDAATVWTTITIPLWYGVSNKKMLLASGTALWYHSGMKPVPIRWVLLKDPDDPDAAAALLSTDLEMDPVAVVNAFIRRWTVEVTLREVRTHLGVETQRQWSDKAIARSTPSLMALFSITTLWAHKLQQAGVPIGVAPTIWYHKTRPTFADALAAVRTQLWRQSYFYTSAIKQQTGKLYNNCLNSLIAMLARAA